jgi:hypothetical protein
MAAIDAGAHVGFEVFTNALERMGDRVVAGVERAMSRPPAQPFVFRPNASGKSAGSGDLVLELGGPASGRFWQVLGITVGGNRFSSTVAGTALIVVSSGAPANAAGTPLQMIHDQYTALPKVVTGYGRTIQIFPPDRLFVVIATPTASTEYDAAATVEQYETGARVQTVAQ